MARRWSGWPLGLVTFTTVVVLECTRVLFSVAYHSGEDIGNLTSGLIVLGLFGVSAVAGMLRRVVAPRFLLGGAVGLLVIGRVAMQAVSSVGFALSGTTAAVGVMSLGLVVIAVRRHGPGGGTGAAVAVSVGLVLDVLLRSTDVTWDIVWRHDPVAWLLSMVLVGGLAVSAFASIRDGVVPDGADERAPLVSFMVWPFVYLATLYTLNPAFLDSSGRVSYSVGLATALLAGAAGLAATVVTARHRPPRGMLVVVGVALAGLAYGITGPTGPVILVMAIAAQALSGLLIGAAAGATPGEDRDGIGGASAAYAVGAVWTGGVTLAYSLHTVEPLPFSNRYLPAAVGLSMVVAAFAVAERNPRVDLLSRVVAWRVVAGVVGAAVVAPLLVAATWPSTATADVTGRPVRVVTFNIEQGLTLGQLHLEQQARHIESVDPDVVVLEEVGRGWSLSGMTDDAAWFSRRLRMPFVWSPAADDQFGNVVLSRLPITEHEILALGKGNGTQDRSAAFVHLDARGQNLLVIGTHLMNGSAAPMHESRADAYRAILAKWDESPRTVLLGDLNTYPRQVPPGWPELDLVLDAGFHTTQDVDECTVPTSNQNCPDWIFVSPDMDESQVQIVVDRPDHRPISAEVSPVS